MPTLPLESIKTDSPKPFRCPHGHNCPRQETGSMPFATRSLHNAESKSGNLIGLFKSNVNSRI